MTTANNDIIRLTANYTYLTGGRPISNVLHFVDNGGGGIIDSLLLSQMGIILEGIFGPLAPEQGVGLFYTTYDVFNVTQGLIIGTLPWPTLVQGGTGGDLSAATVVALLRMVTPKSRVQGRVNLVGVPEAKLADSTMTGLFVTAALLVGAQLLNSFPVGPSFLQYTVFNQEFKTFTMPVSVALGSSSRSLGRRRLA